MFQKDFEGLSEHDLIERESQMTELEFQLMDKNALIIELQDELRDTQDICDELKADNEKMKRTKKRAMQESKRMASVFTATSKKR